MRITAKHSAQHATCVSQVPCVRMRVMHPKHSRLLPRASLSHYFSADMKDCRQTHHTPQSSAHGSRCSPCTMPGPHPPHPQLTTTLVVERQASLPANISHSIIPPAISPPNHCCPNSHCTSQPTSHPLTHPTNHQPHPLSSAAISTGWLSRLPALPLIMQPLNPRATNSKVRPTEVHPPAMEPPLQPLGVPTKLHPPSPRLPYLAGCPHQHCGPSCDLPS